jgi:hypothetical protein
MILTILGVTVAQNSFTHADRASFALSLLLQKSNCFHRLPLKPSLSGLLSARWQSELRIAEPRGVSIPSLNGFRTGDDRSMSQRKQPIPNCSEQACEDKM